MKKGIIISAIVALVIGLPILKQSLGGAKSVEVEIEKLEKRTIRSSTLASGTLTHENRALISTEIIGRVAEVLVEEGEAVAEGQLLLRIDDTPYLSEVEQFTALEKIQSIEVKRHQLRVENLEKNWKRQQKLHRDGLLDDTSFENATHSVDLARIDLQTAEESLVQSRARLAQAQDRLSKTRILSPFKGIVTSVDIKPGEMAIASSTNIPGSSLMTVADPLSIHTEVNVDEADIANIRIGQEAEVVAVAYPDKPIKGIVEAVASTARIPPGRQSLSFAVKIRFEEPELLQLKPGMSCRAEIYTHNAEALLAVPVQAIQSSNIGSDDETFYIYVDENQRAKKIEVETGIADDDYQAIEGEIKEGQSIIIGPDRELRSLSDGTNISYKEK